MSLMQNILLVVLAGLVPNDKYGMTLGLRWPAITAVFAGIIIGDMQTALIVGGTLQLMSLGIASIGGSSVPEYGVGCVVACAIAATTQGGVEAGLAIGIPVSMLMVQFDVIAKVANASLVKRSETYCEAGEFGKMTSILLLGPVIMWMTAAIPTAIAVFAGPTVVDAILAAMPVWFSLGLRVAAKMLPVVGISLLLNYMPSKKYFFAILLGYFLFAYLNVPMMGIAIAGAVVAMVFYMFNTQGVAMNSQEVLEDE